MGKNGVHHNVDLTGQLYKSYNLLIRSSNVSTSLVFKILIFFFLKKDQQLLPPKLHIHIIPTEMLSPLCSAEIYGHMIQASFLCIGHDHFQEKKSEYLKTAGNEGRG